MEVVLSAPRGFCAGVERAINIVELCIDCFGSPIYVRHEIVHNRYVVDKLRKEGAIFVDELSDVPDGHTVVFSAHGVAPTVREEARARNLHVIDATCPLVTKVHLEVLKYSAQGYTVIVVGHIGHPEVIGTMGEAPNHTILVDSIKQAHSVEVENPDMVVALTQTTLSLDDTRTIVGVLRQRFPNLITRNDICYATTNRQTAVKTLAKQVDIVLVIGAENSSNCNRLREVAESYGVPSFLINGPDEINESWLKGVKRAGITSGASTPEVLVDAVIQKLQPTQVTTSEVIKENVSFVLPPELRNRAGNAPPVNM